MLFRQGRKAQSTAEYAILIALVVGVMVAMQVYVRRGLQGRIKDVVDYTGKGGQVGDADFSFTGQQYEPYYLTSSASTQQKGTQNERLLIGGGVERGSDTTIRTDRNQTLGWTDYNANATP